MLVEAPGVEPGRCGVTIPILQPAAPIRLLIIQYWGLRNR